MICILIGVVVPPPESWELLQSILEEDVTSVDEQTITWTHSTLAPTIVEDEGTPTLLLRANTEASPEAVVEVLETVLANRLEEAVTCELWASCPAPLPLPLPPADGYNMELSCSTDTEWAAAAAEMMLSTGVIHQRHVLSPSAVEQLRMACLEAIDNVDASLTRHRPSIVIGKDSFLFREIASRGNERFDLRLEGTVVKDLVDSLILENAQVKSFANIMFGADFDYTYDVSVVFSRPGAPAQGWHADGNHIKGASDAGWIENGWKTRLARAYAICLFIPLVDLTDETGFTQFWPESHRHKALAGFASVAELTQATWNGKCAAGDGVWYDYRLFHRGMPNQSDMLRPVLQVIFKKPWYVERANYGTEPIIPRIDERSSDG